MLTGNLISVNSHGRRWQMLPKSNSKGLKGELISPTKAYGVWMLCISWLHSRACFGGSRQAPEYGSNTNIPDMTEARDSIVLIQTFNTSLPASWLHGRLNTYKSSIMS